MDDDNILDSVPQLIGTFLPPVDNVNQRRLCLFAFLLGLLCTDGAIDWRWGGNPQNVQAVYQEITIFARDPYLIHWLQDELEHTGCATATWTTNVNNLYLSSLDVNVQNLLMALNLLQEEGVPLDGKLLLLREFILRHKKGTFANDASEKHLVFRIPWIKH